ncbi:hypothetical protein EJB05_30985 [Eragrostis curvula]|uniref:BHLH domain-containing protein n=1 Tax=Eragrostis curvula TaxID=38414 RepID=A0A5J9UCE6_9POAL|nr:hypothetical protein EJB05_30985 [Eragrostis curvula]
MSDGNEFAELLWENGQAVVHGRRKQPQTAFPPFTCGGSSSSKAQEKHPVNGDPVALLKTGGVYGAGGMAPSAHDFCSGLDAARGNGDLDDTVPWIHYPIIEEDDGAAPALAGSYSPDFFSELQAAAAVAANLTSLPPSMHQTANNRSNGIATSTKEQEPSKESHRMSAPATRAEPQAKFTAAKQPRLGGSGDALMNFSLFSRPAAMARASLQQSVQRPPPPLGTDKPSNVTVTGSTRVESTVVQASSGPRTAPVSADQRTAWPQARRCASIAQQHPQTRLVSNNKSCHGTELATTWPCRERLRQRRRLRPQSRLRRCAPAMVLELEMMSPGDNRRGRAKLSVPLVKRIIGSFQDLEDESGGLRRSGSRGTKRSRTAEVHNLSERRRRDRINEKMRALQELIPNCNKIDKASMLDEAIEYLKTLQLQVQMMSMGSGLCVPPMLLPPTMQHLQIPQMAHFPHLGMGLGYGMGVFDMNSTATVPLQPMPGAHFPCSMIPGAALQGFGIPGRNTLPMFGVHGQAIHPSVPGVQPFPSLASLPVRPNLNPQVSATMANMVQEQQQVANQQQQSLNNEGTQGANTGDPQLQTILQVPTNQLQM